jgi:uncharacterized protein (DUF2235 family)
MMNTQRWYENTQKGFIDQHIITYIMYKRLITCSDGTWDKPAMKDSKGNILSSNVCLLYDAIASVDSEGIAQLKAYDTGVGSTYKLMDRIAGGITGAGIDAKIKDSYLFLVLNYEPGDHIYLFGFSRGAYTARSLAGFIRCCGILKPQNMHLIEEAFRLYRDRNSFTDPHSDLMSSFRRNYSSEDITRIKFIGVWDTVGALGIPMPAWRIYNRERYMFHDTKLSSTVDYAYQALAVDEHRKMFAPVLWDASEDNENGRTIEMEQRWFSGVHVNIGGGSDDMGLSNNTLQWMVEKAQKCGLAFAEEKIERYEPNVLAKGENSFVGIYYLGGWISRKIKEARYQNQVIDESVFVRIKEIKAYRPTNIIPEFLKL